MQTLTVDLPDCTYPIHIGEGVFDSVEYILPFLPAKKPRVAIVTNTTIAPLYLASLQTHLEAKGISVLPIILPDGEAYKTWETLNLIFNTLLEARCERKTTLIALGGGVIGDMTGFAAACYQRGVPFIQIPTTLLAQVDSSVGGKTAINHPAGKNMIGAFYQPKLVLADMGVLKTLPKREFSAGLAEVIKYALIGDTDFLSWLEANIEALLAQDLEALTYAVRVSCAHKAKIVGEDEKESGIRALLNLGHTFGHAIEAGMGYGTWLHGEAVAAGMVLAAETSQLLGWLSEEEVQRVVTLLKRAELPTYAPNLGIEAYLNWMGLDKKVEGGRIRFVLLKGLGQGVISSDPTPAILEQVLTGRWIAG